MANFNKQPNKSQAGANIQAAGGAQGQFGTEFASETNAAEVKAQNARSAQGGQGAAGAAGAAGAFGAEFASETDAAEVRQQNAQSHANKAKNSGNYGQQ